jgi:hypothetical protein
MIAALVLLAGCTGGNPMNMTRQMNNEDGRLGTDPGYVTSAAQCRAKIHRQVDGIGGPSDPDYNGLFNDCMAKAGWVMKAPKPSTIQLQQFNG